MRRKLAIRNRRPKWKYILVFLGLSISVAFTSNIQAQSTLSYDGYYVSLPDAKLNLYKYYLRFYSDGTVIGVNTAGKPENLLNWFKKENETPYRGKYILSDSTLKITMKSKEGEVIYNGVFTRDNKLIFHVKSGINKYEANEEYSFLKMDKLGQ